jgi:hypothetical protein
MRTARKCLSETSHCILSPVISQPQKNVMKTHVVGAPARSRTVAFTDCVQLALLADGLVNN